MTMQSENRGCAWCSLPKACKGLMVGMAGSLLFHGLLLGGLACSNGSEVEAKGKKYQRVAYVGEIVIKARKPTRAATQPKEI